MSKIELYNADCLEQMKKISNETIDLIVTSPPYYAGKEYEDQNKTLDGYLSYKNFLINIFKESHRILKKGGHLWINIDDVHTSLKSVFKVNKVLPTHAYLITELSDIFDYKEMILWRKIRGKHASGGSQRLLGSYGRFGSPGSIPIVQECEYILWFKKGGIRKDLNDALRKKSALTNEEFKQYGMQIWDIKPERAKRVGHPAPFPTEIPERIIKLSSFVGDTVLDCFMGSGTTGIACKKLNRNFIGIELNKKYFDIAQDRINNTPVFINNKEIIPTKNKENKENEKNKNNESKYSTIEWME